MFRLAAGITAISVGAIAGFDSHPLVTVTAVVGAGLACSVLDRILPDGQLEILHVGDDRR